MHESKNTISKMILPYVTEPTICENPIQIYLCSRGDLKWPVLQQGVEYKEELLLLKAMGKGKDWSEMMVDIKEHKLFGRYLRKKQAQQKKAAQKVGKQQKMYKDDGNSLICRHAR